MDNQRTYNNQDAYDEINRLISEINRVREINTIRQQNQNQPDYSRNFNLEIISILRDVLHSYNANMHIYQENIRAMLQTISSLVQENQRNVNTQRSANLANLANPTNLTQTPPLSQNFSQNLSQTLSQNLSQTLSQNLSQNLSPIIDYVYNTRSRARARTRQQPVTPGTVFTDNVIVRPTQEQIEAATTSFQYVIEDESRYNTNCPITMDEFLEGEDVCRITHCGHTFRRHAISHWFESNVRCPVCRYDVREGQTSPITQPSRSNNSMTNRMTNSLLDIINEYYTGSELSNNFVYTFEFLPVNLDSSNNRI